MARARYEIVKYTSALREQVVELQTHLWSGEIEESNFVARRVGFLYFATCAAPSYIATHGKPEHPQDLARHRCINHFSPHSGRVAEWIFSKNGARVHSVFGGHVALDDENSYVAAADAGLGCRCPESRCRLARVSN